MKDKVMEFDGESGRAPGAGSLQRLRHKGRNVAFLNLRGSSRATCEAALASMDMAAREPTSPLRLLVDITDSCVDPDVMLRWKRSAPEHLGKLERAAVLGAEGLRQVALSGYLYYARLMGLESVGKVRQFKAKEEALEWLSEA